MRKSVSCKISNILVLVTWLNSSEQTRESFKTRRRLYVLCREKGLLCRYTYYLYIATIQYQVWCNAKMLVKQCIVYKISVTYITITLNSQEAVSTKTKDSIFHWVFTSTQTLPAQPLVLEKYTFDFEIQNKENNSVFNLFRINNTKK